jgi:tetratricopeptide (TPR) repeat protein
VNSVDFPAATGDSPKIRRRQWCLRAIAVLLPFLLVASTELLCTFTGWGDAEISDDPFIEFAGTRPLFELTSDRKSWHTSPSRRQYFKEDSFSATKPAGEFRIFVFGGSTVQGNPFSIETSFPSYLQIALENADPDRPWKVVNCGGVSYASYRLVPIMQECLAYEPDLFIFCEGHNEFLEKVSYAAVREAPAAVSTTFGLLNRLRTFRLLRSGVLSFSAPAASSNDSESPTAVRPVLPTDVDTLLDHDGGFAVYHRNDSHAASVVSHFRSNLQRMVDLCQQNSVPLLFILPPSNLSDCPPFKPEFSDSLSESDRGRIADLLQQARKASTSRLTEAIKMAEAATRIDPRYALAWYELGHLQFAAHDFTAAERSFRRARDEDTCPLRMTTSLEAAMQQVVEENRLPFLNAHELLQANTTNGIVGNNVVVDHVHPSFRGHEDIAVAIAKRMFSDQIATTVNPNWIEATHQACQQRLQSLDNLYFLRGRRHLENLKLWAAGRSAGPPLKTALP